MSTELLTGLTGILVGWFLKEISSLFSQYRENKRKLGKVIFRLLELRNYNLRFKDLSKGALNLYEHLPTEEIEQKRQKLLDKHLEGRENFDQYHEEIATDISKIDPIIAYEFKDNHRTSKHLKKVKLDKSSHDETVYKTQLNLIDITAVSRNEYYEETILKLAKKKSYIFYFKMKSLLKKDQSPIEGWDTMTKKAVEIVNKAEEE